MTLLVKFGATSIIAVSINTLHAGGAQNGTSTCVKRVTLALATTSGGSICGAVSITCTISLKQANTRQSLWAT